MKQFLQVFRLFVFFLKKKINLFFKKYSFQNYCVWMSLNISNFWSPLISKKSIRKIFKFRYPFYCCNMLDFYIHSILRFGAKHISISSTPLTRIRKFFEIDNSNHSRNVDFGSKFILNYNECAFETIRI